MFEPSESHLQILSDLTEHYLEPMSGVYERLRYLGSLWNPATATYQHDALSAAYPAERVHEIAEHCHEEIFERLLESPLAAQEEELARYFSALGHPDLSLRECKEILKSCIPSGAPNYLRELFCSNQSVLCELLLGNRTPDRSNK